jgi:MFS family permease
VTQAGGRREQGTLLGLTQSITSVCQIVAPLIAGILITHEWLAAWALMLAAAAVLGIVSSFAERKTTPAA